LTCATTTSEVTTYGGIEICILLLLLLMYHFTLVKEALIEIGCVVTDVVGRWLVVTRVHCGQTVHPRPIVTMEH